MLINLSEVLTQDDKILHTEVVFQMETFECRHGSYEVVSSPPFDLTLTNLGKRKVLVEGEADISIAIPCSRCLEKVRTDFHLTLCEEFDFQILEQSGQEDTDEREYVVGYELDIDKMVYSEILLNWPMRVLCSEDCMGICKKCGINRNLRSCDCDITELDPRMAAIRDIFNNFKEV